MASKRLISDKNKPKGKSEVTTIEQEKEIIDEYEKGPRIIDFLAEYCMGKPIVATILKNKEAIKRADVTMDVKNHF